MKTVTVRVPATTANMGPGFDSLGCALSLYNTFTFRRAERTSVSGCDPAYAGEDNLALQAFRAACRAADVTPPPVALHITAHVPVSRGLGSSATLLVGGAMGARALLSLPLSEEEIFFLVNRMEGHPDNVAPALFGGLRASMQEEGVPLSLPLVLHPSLRFCALIPDYEVKTHAARDVLPASVPFSDATANGAHVAVTVAALATGDGAVLARAMTDRLHEPYRTPLMPEFDAVKSAASGAGALAFFLSGSGSTCMAIYRNDAFPAELEARLSGLSHHWRVLSLMPDPVGADVRITEE